MIVNVDGGSRGNPGPAAIATVIRDADGEVVERQAATIGEATNNVAEYKALLLGIARAASHRGRDVELISDSELIVRQVKGDYKVKEKALQPLHGQVMNALDGFERWSIRHVKRDANAEADELVNEALDAAG